MSPTGEGRSAPVAELLVDAHGVKRRIEDMGSSLRTELAGCPHPPVFVGILKGSTFFLADLVRAFGADVVVDFMAISSYGTSGTGVVRIIKDLETDITGRDVVIVEDIVDTGLTLTFLRRALQEREPSSLRAVTLLDKDARRIVPVDVTLSGFTVPDVFVVGYGLDFQGLYRNVPHLVAVLDLPRLANHPALLVATLYAQG